jgi:zinc transport system ATP-binding protein
MSEPVLSVRDVTVKLGHLTILQNVNMEVERGDVVGVVGPNGGGKTTLLNAVLGNIPLTSGEVLLFGKRIESFNDFDLVGYVAQNAIQFDPLFPATVKEIVSLGRLSRKKIGRRLNEADRDAVERAINLMGLGNVSDRKISELSGGQKQRIFIAKALARRPRLLILDEATAGLDVCMQDHFVNVLRALRKESDFTVITVSHDLSGVMCQANKLAVVNRRLMMTPIVPGTDPTDMLRKAYGEHFTFIFHHDHNVCTNPLIEVGGERGARQG